MLYHVVLFTMKERERHQLQSLIGALRELADLPMVEALACGTNLASSEYDAGLVVQLAGAAALADYRSHPTHRPVLERLTSACRVVAVADFMV
jgi:stress responsive alpha/beta barrel protein